MADSTDPSPSPAIPPAPLSPERERIIARLTDAFARDELSVEDFEGRVTLAYEARTGEALAVLTRDLPERQTPSTLPAEPPPRIASVLSNVVRRGPQRVPPRLEMRSWAGNLELDLREARFTERMTVIEVDVVLGNLEIRLPHGVEVENATRTMLASFEAHHPGRPAGAPPVEAPAFLLRFSGRLVLGNVTVRVG